MSLYFSDLFEEVDKDSAEFTACVAVLLFKELRSASIEIEEKDVQEQCCHCSDFDVPYAYTQDTNLACTVFPDGTKHCLLPVYKFCPQIKFPLVKDFMKKIRSEIVFYIEKTNALNNEKIKIARHPNEIHGKIVTFGGRYFNSILHSQRSSHYA